jgi:hypothetical protein
MRTFAIANRMPKIFEEPIRDLSHRMSPLSCSLTNCCLEMMAFWMYYSLHLFASNAHTESSQAVKKGMLFLKSSQFRFVSVLFEIRQKTQVLRLVQ